MLKTIIKIAIQLIIIITCWYYEWFGENSMLFVAIYESILINLMIISTSNRIYIENLSAKQEEALAKGTYIILNKKNIKYA